MQRRSDGHPLLSWLKKAAGEYCNRQPEPASQPALSICISSSRHFQRNASDEGIAALRSLRYLAIDPGRSAGTHRPWVSHMHGTNARTLQVVSPDWRARAQRKNTAGSCYVTSLNSFSVTHEHNQTVHSRWTGRAGQVVQGCKWVLRRRCVFFFLFYNVQ